MSIQSEHYDCVVIGGGPAGSATAALVAEAGYQTLLLERESVPRFHVGESLMPETYWCFERLGVLDKMKKSDYVQKASVQFVSSTGKESSPFFFEQHDPRESSRTWQVERAEFDKMLFDNAAEKGAECVDQARVLRVLMENGVASGVQVQQAEGPPMEVTARVVVDATGQQALVANQQGMREDDQDLKKVAIWNYFRGAFRSPGEQGGSTIILHTRDKDSWFWFIPLRDDITSIGVVADRDYLVQERGSPEEVFAEELELCPVLANWLSNAEETDRFRVAKEFSYRTGQQAGEGWVLVGDAFGFIDPIYSSGVYFALQTGLLAADAIIEGLAGDDLSGRQLGCWIEEFESGSIWIRKLVDAYYSNEFSFGQFLKEFPSHQGNLTDLLIGRIFYEGAGKIFDDMDPALEAARNPGSME
tara:strand:- start:16 stop:1266 length:1251 start_codon:yes stop_codon:yes gene_type:complete